MSGPSYETEKGPRTPPNKRFLTPGRLIAPAIGAIAAAAGLIANLQGISDFLQPSLDGQWLLTETIKQSSDTAYIGKTATFRLFLASDGHKLTGDGEKIQFDGKDLPSRQRQPIHVTGSVSAGRVNLEYLQEPGRDGAARQTSGQLDLGVIRAGVFRRRAVRLNGSFSATAASTSGTAVAIPQPN